MSEASKVATEAAKEIDNLVDEYIVVINEDQDERSASVGDLAAIIDTAMQPERDATQRDHALVFSMMAWVTTNCGADVAQRMCAAFTTEENDSYSFVETQIREERETAKEMADALEASETEERLSSEMRPAPPVLFRYLRSAALASYRETRG